MKFASSFRISNIDILSTANQIPIPSDMIKTHEIALMLIY